MDRLGEIDDPSTFGDNHIENNSTKLSRCGNLQVAILENAIFSPMLSNDWAFPNDWVVKPTIEIGKSFPVQPLVFFPVRNELLTTFRISA
ncbi:hypothetical protein [Ollibium composti]|uniref:Uncharacterized protein n=1 Tax=Ollibium composti TaxID=2675109 RepID=A0ABY2Q9C3_9HYPH|nr:hypothetical protein [Mesorhizobium composti]THF58151.1 hypothetical protein E6C48_05900 [Mesorhizobium composti]